MPFDVYPMTRYHPVLGGVTVDTPDEAQKMFHPEHDWFPTPQEADLHRNQREAAQVEHNSIRVMQQGLAARLGDKAHDQAKAGNVVGEGTVMHSVTMHETQIKPVLNGPSPEELSNQMLEQDKRRDEARESRAKAAASAKVEAVPASTHDMSA